MNKVLLTGNLTKAPEQGTTANGKDFCRFTIAVNRQQEADFFNIVAWNGLAEICGKFLEKGSKVGIVGCLRNRSFENKDGAKVTVTEIVADEVEFLSKKAEKQGEEPTKQSKYELEPLQDDNLPF